jgi:ABC-type hemin transport system substrate-binding protein
MTPPETVDATGMRIEFTPPVRRVVSLVPSVTESVFALGAGGALVGRTRYCIHPANDVRAVARIGGTKDPDVEAIVSLNPDVVLANREENLEKDIVRLRDAGVTVHVCEPKSPDDALAYVAFLGMLLDRIEEAAAIVYSGEAVLHELSETLREREALDRLRVSPRGVQRVAALVWREPWMVAGGDTYISGVLNALGLVNAFAASPRYPRVDISELAAARPDVILLPSEPFEFTPAHAIELEHVLSDHGAANPPRMVLCNGEDLMWFGARTPGALRRLRHVLA